MQSFSYIFCLLFFGSRSLGCICFSAEMQASDFSPRPLTVGILNKKHLSENKQKPCLMWRRTCNREIPTDKETVLKSDSNRTNPEAEQKLHTLMLPRSSLAPGGSNTAILLLRKPELYSSHYLFIKVSTSRILRYIPENASRLQNNNLTVKHSFITILS